MPNMFDFQPMNGIKKLQELVIQKGIYNRSDLKALHDISPSGENHPLRNVFKKEPGVNYFIGGDCVQKGSVQDFVFTVMANKDGEKTFVMIVTGKGDQENLFDDMCNLLSTYFNTPVLYEKK